MSEKLRLWLVPVLGGIGIGLIIALNIELMNSGQGINSPYFGFLGGLAILGSLFLKHGMRGK